MRRPDRDSDRSLEDLVAAVLEAIDAGRAVDLDQLCGGDEDVRRRVDAILAEEALAVDLLRPVTPRRLPDMPTDIGGFEVRALLGSGATAVVYEAWDERLDREVAIKVLREEAADPDGASTKRFEREASVTASLDHPNIVPIYGTGTDRGRAFLVMKLLRGDPASHCVGKLRAERVAAIGRDVAGALHAAHEVGVLHRDVKPANVILVGEFTYVVDFGLARVNAPMDRLTRSEAAPGTLAYMAPEVLRMKQAPFDPRSDVYGLGMTLYELLSGRLPFDLESPERLMRETLLRDPAPLRLRGRERDLETVVLRALEKDPGRRFESAAAMRDELQRWLDGQPVLTRSVSGLTRMWRRARRRPLLTVLSCVAVLSLSLLVLTLWLSGRERESRDFRTMDLVRGALAQGNIYEARELADALSAEAATGDLGSRIERMVEEAAAVQDLVFLLQSPNLRLAGEDFDRAVRRLRKQNLSRAPRALAALAIATVVSENVNGSLPPGGLEAIESELPRTWQVLVALAEGRELEGLEWDQSPSSPTDHLLAASALRARSVRARSWSRELGRASVAGPDQDAIRLAKAADLERQGQHERALDMLSGVRPTSRYAAPLMAYRSRLQAFGATSRDATDQALALLDRALAEAARADRFQGFVILQQLEVLSVAEDLGEFWAVWGGAESNVGSHFHYWRMAAYAAQNEGDFKRAHGLFDRARDVCKNDVLGRQLEVEMLRCRCLQSRLLSESKPLDPRFAAEHERLKGVAEEALEQLERGGLGRTDQASLLFTAALCQFHAVSLEAGWDNLQKACESHDHEAIVEFCFRVQEALMVKPRPPADGQALVVLQRRAMRARGFAQGLLAVEAARVRVAPFGPEAARRTIMIVEFCFGRSREALRLRSEVLSGRASAASGPYCEEVAAWGGRDPTEWSRLSIAPADALVQLIEFRSDLDLAVGKGWLTRGEARAALDRWLKMPSVRARRATHAARSAEWDAVARSFR